MEHFKLVVETPDRIISYQKPDCSLKIYRFNSPHTGNRLYYKTIIYYFFYFFPAFIPPIELHFLTATALFSKNYNKKRFLFLLLVCNFSIKLIIMTLSDVNDSCRMDDNNKWLMYLLTPNAIVHVADTSDVVYEWTTFQTSSIGGQRTNQCWFICFCGLFVSKKGSTWMLLILCTPLGFAGGKQWLKRENNLQHFSI